MKVEMMDHNLRAKLLRKARRKREISARLRSRIDYLNYLYNKFDSLAYSYLRNAGVFPLYFHENLLNDQRYMSSLDDSQRENFRLALEYHANATSVKKQIVVCKDRIPLLERRACEILGQADVFPRIFDYLKEEDYSYS